MYNGELQVLSLEVSDALLLVVLRAAKSAAGTPPALPSVGSQPAATPQTAFPTEVYAGWRTGPADAAGVSSHVDAVLIGFSTVKQSCEHAFPLQQTVVLADSPEQYVAAHHYPPLPLASTMLLWS